MKTSVEGVGHSIHLMLASRVMTNGKKPPPDLRAALKSASEKLSSPAKSRSVGVDDSEISLEKFAKAWIRTKNFPKK